MITTDERKTYNGWTNYATWCVHLWLTNDSETEEDARATARYIAGRNENPEAMRDYVLDYALGPLSTASLGADLIGAELSDVDWRELLTALTE